MKDPTLSDVVQKSQRIFFDNSLLSKDINREEVLESMGGDRDRQIHTIALRLGAASNFREVKYQPLHRQALYAARLWALMSENHNLLSTPAVVAEYAQFIIALETSLEFLSSHSSTKKRGEKQKALEDAIRYHHLTYQLLEDRNTISDQTVIIANAIRENGMHLSLDGKYVKRLGRADPTASRGDAELAAEALIQAKEYLSDVALITGDTDIVNIIRNFQILSSRSSLPSSLQALSLLGNVTVYYPSSKTWVPHFGLSVVD